MQAWDIEFRALSVGYGEHVVLRDVNAVLPGGKVSVILGGSGCGKSPCCAILSAFRAHRLVMCS